MPKKMKPSATAKKAAGPKKRMKTNQDGGSILAEDPGAAGKQLVANQKGAAKTYGGNKGDESAKTKAKVKTVKENATKDYEGGARMGYSQKFGAGRMNGYDMGAAKVDDIMKGGAKMMAKGPGQMKDIKSGKMTTLTTGMTEKNPEGYQISVNENAGYANMARELGGNTLPNVFRSVTHTEDTDPAALNISQEEKKRRQKATYPKN